MLQVLCGEAGFIVVVGVHAIFVISIVFAFASFIICNFVFVFDGFNVRPCPRVLAISLPSLSALSASAASFGGWY